MLARPWPHRVRVAVAVCAAMALLLASAGWTATHLALRGQADEVKTRSMLYAFSIISNLTPGLEPSSGAGVQRVGHYLALSGLVYSQLLSGDEVLFQTAASEEAGVMLDDVQGGKIPHLRFIRIARRLVVDLTIPYGRLRPDSTDAETEEEQTFPTGYLRLGIDAGDFAAQAARTKRLAAASGLATWIGLSLLVWTLLRRRPAAVSAPAVAAASAPRTFVAGSLALDMDTGQLDAAGRIVRLTPKQRDLVALFLSEPGRPFRDSEILARVWADSRYANSRDVKQYVYLIRRRLAAAGLPADRILVNEPGLGYRIVSDAAPASVDLAVDPLSVDDPPREDEGCPQQKERRTP